MNPDVVTPGKSLAQDIWRNYVFHSAGCRKAFQGKVSVIYECNLTFRFGGKNKQVFIVGTIYSLGMSTDGRFWEVAWNKTKKAAGSNGFLA
jgi:hypothetical protein